MIDIKNIIEKLKSKTGFQKNKELAEDMGLNSNQINVWINKNTINLHIVIDYCNRKDISLDWLFFDKKYDIEDDIIVLIKTILKKHSKKELISNLNKLLKDENNNSFYDNEFLIDYIVISLKRFKRIDRSNFLNYFMPTAEFITRQLKKVDSKIIEDLSIYNARDKMIDFLKKVELSRFLDTETKRFKIIEEIKIEFSAIECYVMLKYPHYFI